MNRLSFNLGDVFFGDSDRFPKVEGEVGGLVSTILSTAIAVAGVIIVFLLVFAGISMIAGAGQGDPQKVGKGRSAATAAVIGFVIIFVTFWIIKAIEYITGVDILQI